MSNKFDTTNQFNTEFKKILDEHQFNTEFQKILDEQGYVTLTQYYELVDKYIFYIGDAESMHPHSDEIKFTKNPLLNN